MGRKPVIKKRYNNEEARHKLAVKALVYFQKNGVKNMTMSQMAKDLSISKTTIYNHYPTKIDLLNAALNYKLESIEEYETVLENLTLPYIERYRKAMIFFCVQLFEVSTNLISEIRENYPELWIRVQRFQKMVYLNLKSYYEIGIEIGVFKHDFSPVFLALDDQQFFEMLGTNNLLRENNLEVLDAFNHHFKLKFNGIVDASYELRQK